jgi:hypothetical protein
MRNYHDLSLYYPNQVTFGKYTIDQTVNKIKASQDILNYYNKGNFDNTYSTQVTLRRNLNEYVMDNGPFEMVSNKKFLDNCYGDILIIGLGLGMIVYPLLNDISVTSITIVEIDPEIIGYIGGIIKSNDINSKVNIVEGDVFEYYKGITRETFDYIYFDYWDRLNEQAYSEMVTVKELYGGNLKDSNSIIHCWCEDIKTLTT